jgi:broad specificity phosphatase PhoE
MTNTKQHVWLVRYGKTQFPLKEFDGPYNSDIHNPEGIEHAQAIATSIASSPVESKPSQVYCSPFTRTVHTAHIIASALGTKLNVEDGLYEWLTPSLLVDRSGVRTYPLSVKELKERFDLIDIEYESKNPIRDEYFPEEEKDLIERCQTTVDGILSVAGGENVVIVAHAPCVQSIAFAMEGVASPAESKLEQLPLGGITRFSRDVVVVGQDGTTYGEWSMDFYGSTNHMPGEYKNGLGLWSLACFR